MTSRRNQLFALLTIVVVAVGAVFLFVGNDDDDDDPAATELPSSPSLPPPVRGEVNAAGEELLLLLDRAEEGRYHAQYEVEGDPAVIGGEMTLELWRDGGRSRRDTHIVSSDGSADTTTIVDADGGVATCNRVDGADWTCFEPEPTGEDGDDATADGDVIGSVRDQLAGTDVQARDDEIDGREVRCFQFPTDEGPGDICVDVDGVVVRLASGETAMVLTDLDDDVPGDVFEAPAELTAPPEPSDDAG